MMIRAAVYAQRSKEQDDTEDETKSVRQNNAAGDNCKFFGARSPFWDEVLKPCGALSRPAKRANIGSKSNDRHLRNRILTSAVTNPRQPGVHPTSQLGELRHGRETMNVLFPVILEQLVARSDDPDATTDRVNASDDFDFVGVGGVQMCVSGRDSSAENNGRGIRLTNLCGIHQGELWKVCPHCKQVKPMSSYGDGGRTTDEYRDQSNCTECRGRYRLND